MKSRYGLEIRAATAADAPGLAELFGWVGIVIAPRVLTERLESSRQQPGVALIAVEWGPPSGVIVAHWYRTLEWDHPVACVTSLLVGPDDRRRGIGRMLLKAASQAARSAGCDVLEMTVGEEADALRAFCQASGFVGNGARVSRGLRKKM